MTQAETRPGAKRRWSWMAQTLVLTNLALLSLAAFAMVGFGSIKAALSFAGGDRILCDAYKKSFGSIADGKDRSLIFQLSNLAARPVKILGAKSSCTCTVAEDLPMTIPPEGRLPLRITIRPRKVGVVAETVRLYTDYGDQTELVIRVTGRISSPPQPQRPGQAPGERG